MPSFDGSCSVVSTMASRSRKINSTHSFNNANKVAVPGIGFATTLSSGDIRVDYKDGSALTVSLNIYNNLLDNFFNNLYSIHFNNMIVYYQLFDISYVVT